MKITHIVVLSGTILLAALAGWLFLACDPPTENDPNFITVTSDKYEMPADKTSTAEITVVVYDNTHAFVEDGTAVYLTTNCGDIAPGVVTTSGGQATATLTSSETECKAIIHAEVPSENRNANSNEINMYDTGPDYIEMYAEPPKIKADGVQTSTITAYITRDLVNPIEDGTEVFFNASAGTLAANTATTTSGFANTTLTSGKVETFCDVTAICEDRSKTIQVEFTSADAQYIVLSANTNSIRADGTSKATITAEVWLEYGVEHVPDDTEVFFTTNLGSISPSTDTTENGIAHATLTSSNTAGIATVYGTSGGFDDSIQVYFYEDGAAGVDLRAYPNAIPADGESELTLTAQVRNGSYEPVENEVVNFSTTRGTLSSNTASTDETGTATIRLKSSTMVDDNVLCTAVAGASSDRVTVRFTQATSDEVEYVQVVAEESEVDVGFTVPEVPPDPPDYTLYPRIIVFVYNHLDDPIIDKNVVVTSECGSIIDETGNPASVGTTDFIEIDPDNWQTCYVCYLKTDTCTLSGTKTISAVSDNVTGTDTINFLADDPCYLSLTADSYMINGGPDGGGTTTLRIAVTDQYLNAVRNGTPVTLDYTCNCSDCSKISINNQNLTTSSGITTTLLSVQADAAIADCQVVITGVASGAAAGCTPSDDATISIAS
ncbi:Ig-like domain-containing protein [bacterium]|nr:Ig-like domain-containing protein [bacterium]